MPRSLLQKLLHLSDRQSMQPDLARALRTTFAIMVPLVLAATGMLGPLEASFVAIAAHTMAGIDIHGPYPLRFAFMLVTMGVMAGCTALGTIAGGSTAWATLAAALVALNSGFWRHLTPEYGPTLAIPTGLVFLMALAFPSQPWYGHALSVLVGASWALVLQMALWPVRAQHPLRRAVASTWMAAGKLFEAMNRAGDGAEEAVIAAETDFRAAFDAAEATLNAVKATRPNLPQLRAVNLAGARLVTRVSALRTAMQPILSSDFGDSLAVAYAAVIDSLNQTSQSVALAVVSRQPSHLAVSEVRFTRLASLLHALRTKLLSLPPEMEDARHAAMVDDLVDGQLSDALLNLVAVTERSGERAVFPLELFDISTWRLQPLAAALNLRPRPDPILLQFTARLALLLMLGVLVAKLCPITHAYWLPFTILIVTQTDYGATRKRAVERLVGTLIGCALGSVFLFLHLSLALALAGIAVAGFAFSFLVKRNYRFAVALVTIMVVLLIDMAAGGKATFEVALERIAFTAAGGAVALIAALIFWPSWEWRRFPPVLADALRANEQYLQQVISRLQAGGPYGADEVAAKRSAEQANASAFGSLARLYADPASQRGGVELAAVIANGSQRLTRLLNLLLLSATPSAQPRKDPALQNFATESVSRLRELIAAVEGLTDRPPNAGGGEPSPLRSITDVDRSEADLLERATMEIQAMQQALQPDGAARLPAENADIPASPVLVEK